jgi:hypothetical protein
MASDWNMRSALTLSGVVFQHVAEQQVAHSRGKSAYHVNYPVLH